MQNEMMQNADMDGVGFLLGMLWVFALGAAMLVAYIGRRTNERKEQTYGYELEVIKTAHAHSQDANHSLANFLTKVKGKGGWDAYFEGYHHNTRAYTKLVTDSSLSTGGVEIVSPPLRGTTRRRRWLSTVAGKLAGLVKIDRTCGVHLHIGLKKPDESWGDEGVYDWDTARLIGTKVSCKKPSTLRFHGAATTSRTPSRTGTSSYRHTSLSWSEVRNSRRLSGRINSTSTLVRHATSM